MSAIASVSPTARPGAEPALPRLVATDGAIAVGNLDAQIDSLDKRSAARSARVGLVELLLSRGQFLGRIADYERAATVAETLVTEAPTDPTGYETRASTHATFHRFDAALADLQESDRLGGGSGDKLAAARRAIFVATGRFDEAQESARESERGRAQNNAQDEAQMGPMELASAGLLAGEMGKDAEAERLLALARAKYPDVSPFPLAWMDAQEAGLLERRGMLAKAKAHYARALALLPLYARAAAHLAALSRPADAVAMLEPVAAQSDDPEVLVQLSDALRRTGRTKEASQRLGSAIARYDDLVRRYPAAFADHAASMWLGAGREPARALPLARINLAARHTAEAYELLLSAALAANDETSVCPEAREAMTLRWGTASVRALAAPIAARCR